MSSFDRTAFATAAVGFLFQMALLFAGIILCGCGADGPAGDYSAKPGQAEAVSAVLEVYGASDVTPPAIRWVSGKDLDCVQEANGKPGFSDPSGHRGDALTVACLGGWTENGGDIVLPLHDSESWDRTYVAHELMHWLKGTHGDPDAGHAGPEWEWNGNDALVSRGNAALGPGFPNDSN